MLVDHLLHSSGLWFLTNEWFQALPSCELDRLLAMYQQGPACRPLVMWNQLAPLQLGKYLGKTPHPKTFPNKNIIYIYISNRDCKYIYILLYYMYICISWNILYIYIIYMWKYIIYIYISYILYIYISYKYIYIMYIYNIYILYIYLIYCY